MSFVRTATKRFKDIPHHDTCMCGDCPTESGKYERLEMWEVLDRCMSGEKIVMLVEGRNRKIKSIVCYGLDRCDVSFEERNFGDRTEKLYRPNDEVRIVNGVTK